MTDLQSGQTFINVMPSMTGFFKKLRTEVQGNKVTQQIGVEYDQRRLAKAKADLEAATKSVEATRRKEADAVGAVRVAEAQLAALREKGITDAGRLAAAEEKVAKAKRASESAASGLQAAEAKRGGAEQRVSRLQLRVDTADAEGETQGFLSRLSGRAEEGGRQVGGRLAGAIGTAVKAGLAGAGIGAAVLASMVIDQGQVKSKLAAQLGATGPLAKEYGDTAGRLWKQGLGTSMDDTAAAVGAVANGFRTLGSEGEVSLDKAAERALNFSKVFDVDVNEAVQATSQLVQNGLAADSTQAFDLMTAAFQRVPAAMRGELPEILNEYGTNFRQLGIEGPAAFSLLVDAADKGKFILDKTGDALKEFTIRGSDMSKSSVDAYKTLGLNAEVMSNQVAQGGAVAGDAMRQVANALLNFQGSDADRANLAIALFGTQMEDIGTDQVPVFMSALAGGEDSMAGFAGAADQMGSTINDNTATSLERLKRELQSGVVEGLESAANWMMNNQGAAIAIGSALGVAATAFAGLATASMVHRGALAAVEIATKVSTVATKAWGIAQTVAGTTAKAAAVGVRVLNAAIRANPMMAIVSVITLLVGALVWFFTKTETGKAIWEKVWSGIQAALSAAWDFIQPIFQKIGDIFSWLYDNVVQPVFTAIKVAVAVVMTVFLLWWEAVKLYLELVGSVISWLWENVARPVWELMKAALSALGDFFGWVWSTLIKPAWEALGAGISWVWESVIRPAWEALKAALQALGDFFAWVWNTVIKPAWDALGAGVNWVWENVIRPAWDALKVALGAVGDFFRSIWETVIRPAWDALGNGIKWVIDNVVMPAWEAMKSALGRVGDFFGTIVDGIKSVWDKLRGYLAKPVNFLINTVWNQGIAKAWNKVAEFIPGLSPASEMAGIPEYATGGPLRGKGTGTSDDILMYGSNGEHVVTAAEVIAAGGHNVLYAIRDMILRGVPFEWDGGQIISQVGRGNLNAYGAKVAQSGLGNVDPQGMFDWLLPKYADGGEIRPKWQEQLENGHRAAKMRNGNPYTWGFEDCSGYMSAIADAILNGGNGKWSWATGSFPGGQPWVPGLGQGFSVGVHDNPGGPGGGHTAGTLTGVGGYSTTNVESGGAHGYVAYGGPAVGADSPQFAGKSPGLFHLAIGADGAFEPGGSGGGPSPQQKQSWLQDKIADVFDKALTPIKSGIGAAIGTPPPEWLGIPPKYLDVGRDKAAGFLSDKVLALGDLLGSVWDKAKGVAGFLTGGLFRDQGGWLPNGLSLVRNETGKREAVLNWDQLELIRRVLQGVGLSGTDKLATEDELAKATPPDLGAIGAQVGTSLLAEWGNDLLGMAGFSGKFEGLQLVDEQGRRRSDEVGARDGAQTDGQRFLLKDVIHPEPNQSPARGDLRSELAPMLERVQSAASAPRDVIGSAERAALELAPVGGGDIFPIVGEITDTIRKEVQIIMNQRDRRNGRSGYESRVR